MEKKTVECPCCKKQWDIDIADRQQLNGCPFCLTPFKLSADEIIVDSLEKAICKVIVETGIEALHHKGRFLSLILDLAPEFKKEIKMVNKSCSQELLARIATWKAPDIMIDAEKAKMRAILLEEEGLSESWANQICDAFAGAIKAVRGETGGKEVSINIDMTAASAASATNVSADLSEQITPRDERSVTKAAISLPLPQARTFNISAGSGSLTDRLEAAYQAAKAGSVSFSSPLEDFVIKEDTLFKYTGNSPAVYVPNGIEIIEKWAFQNNKSLVSITLPDTLREIKDSAFYGCSSLMVVQFPKGLEKIGNFSFRECPGLKAITIPRETELQGSVFDCEVKIKKA